MKYVDRVTENLNVSGGYLFQGNKCLGKIVSIDAEYYTIIPVR